MVLVALATGAVTASAGTADGVAASSMQFPIGPVGIAAVVVGLGGLVTGLVRHHRRIAAAAAAPQPVVIEPEPADKAAA
jgi:hypothetical protein